MLIARDILALHHLLEALMPPEDLMIRTAMDLIKVLHEEPTSSRDLWIRILIERLVLIYVTRL
jgi:hypothetical protein